MDKIFSGRILVWNSWHSSLSFSILSNLLIKISHCWVSWFSVCLSAFWKQSQKFQIMESLKEKAKKLTSVSYSSISSIDSLIRVLIQRMIFVAITCIVPNLDNNRLSLKVHNVSLEKYQGTYWGIDGIEN